MSLVPNTKIALKYVKAPPKKFAPLYYAGTQDAGPALASVNAGNSGGLYVGGDGINLAFHDVFVDNQQTAQYAGLHKALLNKAAGVADAFEAYAAGSNPLAFSYVRTAQVPGSAAGSNEGVCFLDVFSPACVPHGAAANAAMVYLAPPFGDNYQDEAAYLKAIASASEHVVETVSGYNAIAGQHGQPAIEALRMCLFSSGIYNTLGVSPHKIARTIYAAACGALAKDAAGLKELQLPVPGDPLFAAVQIDLL